MTQTDPTQTHRDSGKAKTRRPKYLVAFVISLAVTLISAFWSLVQIGQLWSPDSEGFVDHLTVFLGSIESAAFSFAATCLLASSTLILHSWDPDRIH